MHGVAQERLASLGPVRQKTPCGLPGFRSIARRTCRDEVALRAIAATHARLDVVDRQLVRRQHGIAVRAPVPITFEDARSPHRVSSVSGHLSWYTLSVTTGPTAIWCEWLQPDDRDPILRSVNDDPRLHRLGLVLADRPFRPAPARTDRPEAAVAILLRPRDQIELLLIRRAERDGDPWSGHIALPGGRRSPTDIDLSATAFRETHEETGIHVASSGAVLGRLDDLVTPGRLPPVVISPFVAAVPADTRVSPDPAEVVDAAWIPLSTFRDPAAASELRIQRGGETLTFPTIVHDDYVIWGLTHHIVMRFVDIVSSAGL